MLRMGASRPWPEALAAFSGERDLDAGAIIDYFAPLERWLTAQNKDETCGWWHKDSSLHRAQSIGSTEAWTASEMSFGVHTFVQHTHDSDSALGLQVKYSVM